jgi:hypothetical protein
MSRNRLNWMVFAVAGLALCTGVGDQALAQGSACVVPTYTGTVYRGLNYQATVQLKLNVTGLVDDKITPGQCVGVAVDSSGFAKPPFSLQIVSGQNFYFSTQGGPSQTASTDRDGDSISLCAESDACGSVGVKITDAQQKQTTVGMRSTNGTWGQPLLDWIVRCQCGGGECQSCWSWSYCQTEMPGCNSHWNDMIEDVAGDKRWITTRWHCNCAAGCGGSSAIMRWCGAPEGSVYEIPGTNGLVKEEYCPPSCPSPFDCHLGPQDCSQPWYPEIRTWCIPDIVMYYEWRCPQN